ncbi:MAG: hypothetical protein ACHP93_00435 [Solirubrobacterales bacterium]
MRATTLLLLWSGLAAVCAGCGGASKTASPAELRLQRSDLVALSRALKDIQGPVASEVAATKRAWPLIANGLPRDAVAIARAPIAAAAQSAASIKLPVLLQEAQAAALTGPAAPLAGLVRSYILLATRGWRLIGAAIDQIEQGSAASARFARQNVALYIESVYDGHFTLAQIGKQLLAGYRKLGGAAAFAGVFSQAEVDALASAYSESSDRLHPHVGTRLGS